MFCVGYLAQPVMAHFGDGSQFGVRIEYMAEGEDVGTAGALALASDRLDDVFLVLNGHSLFDINYLDLGVALRRSPGLAAVAFRTCPEPGRYERAYLRGRWVVSFGEKWERGRAVINGGVYAIRREALAYIGKSPASLEHDVFPVLAEKRSLLGRVYSRPFVDIGTPEGLAKAAQAAVRWMKKPAAFLDRDGVLNANAGYIHRREDFVWVRDAQRAVKWLNDRGYLVFVVTNQGGIARGYYTEEDFAGLMNWVGGELAKCGAHLDAVYYCPHHPTEGRGEYLRVCECRKPGSGLFNRALSEWKVDVRRSFFIDDTPANLDAGARLGIRSYLFRGGSLLSCVRLLANVKQRPTTGKY